ncbi:MAG TPA: AarF/UbiB family protein [Candidatus Ozemobacteraceae bacterium]|nr:AarF/UbiB family protein [Candidatus Ozemobacteraceae bacterium]
MFSFSWSILGDLSFEQLQKYVGVFLPELTDKPHAEQKRLLQEYLRDADLNPFKAHFAAELLRITGLEKAVPDVYAEFRPVMSDAIRFLLSSIRGERLKEICIEQLLLPPGASPEERLFHLAAGLPTLYKLGQIVARNRHLEPSLRTWLEKLETGYITADFPTLASTLEANLAPYRTDYEWSLEPHLLSEASVGAIVGLHWRRRGEREFHRGVVKLLKPGVRENLDEELALLDQLGDYLEQQRQRYGLTEFPFRDTTRDIADALRRETDFAREQRHLREARRSLGAELGVTVPELLPFCTDRVTAMQRIEGHTLSTCQHSDPEREHLAERLFRAVIGQALFADEPAPLFHGDLHAGNMMTVTRGTSQMPDLFLIDWSQAGRLTRGQREHLMQAAIGMYLKSPERLSRAFVALAEPQQNLSEPLQVRIETIVRNELRESRAAEPVVIRRLFGICDTLIREGIKFPADLLLFRKTVFSFFDVVASLAPNFNADLCLLHLLAPMIMREFGPRTLESLLPGLLPGNTYRSLVPTPDLVQVGVSTGLAVWRRQMLTACSWWSNTCLGTPRR